MKYLSAEDILVIHAMIIDETGGMHGVRDVGLLQSIAERPKMSAGGKPAFITIYNKAATYLEGLARHHSFVDGNKRTALAASARFLHINKHELTASDKEAEHFVLIVVKEKPEIKKITERFKKNTQRK